MFLAKFKLNSDQTINSTPPLPRGINGQPNLFPIKTYCVAPHNDEI